MSGDELLALEWLETGGTGAFAAGSVAGACTQRYHNIFMVPRQPPVSRVILVNNLEETVSLGERTFALSANVYPGTIHPEGHRYIDQFQHEPWPKWNYHLPDPGIRIRKELFQVHGQSLVAVGWHLDEAPEPVQFGARPMMSGRNFQGLQQQNSDARITTQVAEDHLSWNPYEDIPVVHAYHNGAFLSGPDWYHDIQYRKTYNHEATVEEDWWTPGAIHYRLAPGDTAYLLFSLDPTLDSPSFSSLRDREQKRRSASSESSVDSEPDRLRQDLERSVLDFRVRRNEGDTLFAGYPWFTDWGRDTFISLPGYMLSTENYDTARKILETFGNYISAGMVPNRFPESGEEPEYNTMDASLWYVHAMGKYVSYSNDESFAKNEGWHALLEILSGYRNGTRYGIEMEEDGLICGGSPNTQLTWMDAKVGETTFTPRDGKPVEIQALWIRALDVASSLAALRSDRNRVSEFEKLQERAIASFRNRFWYEEGGYLYDVVDGHRGNDRRVRPNQIFAALFDDLLTAEQRRSVVDRVESDLLTPVGLRTLAPEEDEFVGEYSGNRYERDRAYHQGTVWPYLMGAFISSWLRVREKTEEQRSQALSFLDGLEEHLRSEACIGQVSEIFDGAPPHEPKGCIAQAWSVAEPLRALYEDVRSSDATASDGFG